MHHFRLPALLLTLLLASCAALDPNPNIGMRSTDLAFSSGDCEGAKKRAEPAAQRGEPWAQFRMGALLIDQKCPNQSVGNVSKAIDWLSKAACYESKSLWERGNELVVGPSGYFNARASSTNAAAMLADIYMHANRPGMSWLYLERARSQFTEDEAAYSALTQKLAYAESVIGAEQLAAIKKDKPNICAVERPA